MQTIPPGKRREACARSSPWSIATSLLVALAPRAHAEDGLPLSLEGAQPLPAPRVVVVGIDAKTIARLGEFGAAYRTRYPKLLEQLERARVRGVALDIYFPENPRYTDATAAIARRAASSSVPVVVSAGVGDDTNAPVFEEEKVVLGAVGYLQVVDARGRGDGLAMPLRQRGRSLLGVELALRANIALPEHAAQLAERITLRADDGAQATGDAVRVSLDSVASVTTVSFIDVLDGTVGREVLEGALVLVGTTDGVTDVHLEPKTGQTVPGVLFHAGIVARLIEAGKALGADPFAEVETAPRAPARTEGVRGKLGRAQR